MAKPQHATVRFTVHEGEPCIESRIRSVGPDDAGPIPKGKILVMRTRVFGSDDEDDTQTELIDDDGSAEAFCPECAASGHDPGEVLQSMMASAFGGGRKVGRNEPCPCGSGRKYKRCCIN